MHKKSRFQTLFILALAISISLRAGGQTTMSEQQDFNQALLLFNQSDFRESGLLFLRLLKSQPENPVYWLNLGNVYYSLKNYPKAISCYGHVIKMQTEEKTTLGPIAELYTEKSYRKSGQTEKALAILKGLQTQSLPPHLETEVDEEIKLLKNSSPSLDAKPDIKLGLENYQSENYEVALTYFESAFNDEPKADTAVMIGLIHLRLNEPREASVALNRALNLNPNPELRANAQDLLHQIQENLWPKKSSWSLWLDLSASYNSNYYENGSSETASAAPASQFSTGLGYRLLQNRPWLIDLNYTFSWQEVSGLPEARLYTHSIGFPLSYQDQTWFIKLNPSFQAEYLGTSPFLDKLGSSLEIHRYIGSFGLGTIYEYFHETSQLSFYNYLNGDTQGTKIYADYGTGPFYLRLYYFLASENIGDLPYSNGTLPLGENSQGYGLTSSWLMNSDWQILLSGIHTEKKFSRASQPQNTKRDDSQNFASFRINYFESPTMTYYFNQEVTLNKSTLGKGSIADKNFDKFISSVGLTWNAFQ